MIGSRYAAMFRALEPRGEIAFVPFLVLGDPTPAVSLALVEALVAGGADALELGLPFSDPVADGPVIQAAGDRALAAGTTPDRCVALLEEIRRAHPALPLGLLTYANLAERRGVDVFYRGLASAGVDSVLLADVPIAESARFRRAALAYGIAPVHIAPPNASLDHLGRIARASEGYVYVTTRAGVTGADHRRYDDLSARLAALGSAGGPPPVLGFGISNAEQVRSAAAAGARGVITGSAIVARIAEGLDRPAELERELIRFCRVMKAATHR